MKIGSTFGRSIIIGLIICLAGYGYVTERAKRIKMEEAARQLVIAYEAEKGDYHNFINALTKRQIEQDMTIHSAQGAIRHLQITIFRMYNDLRKYDKSLPPWGEDRPIEPDEDKWTSIAK